MEIDTHVEIALVHDGSFVVQVYGVWHGDSEHLDEKVSYQTLVGRDLDEMLMIVGRAFTRIRDHAGPGLAVREFFGVSPLDVSGGSFVGRRGVRKGGGKRK